MRTAILLGVWTCATALAQQTVAPSPEQVGPPRGSDLGGYNITNSFELGYRFLTQGGDLGLYRSQVNYGDGLRLLSGSLGVYSREGHGGPFDALVIRTAGIGNDPYQFSSLHLEKNNLYTYDLVWRLNDYFNPALAVANGQHFLNTERRLQDHDFTLRLTKNVKLLAGYSRNSQEGAALSTVQMFDDAGDEFPLFQNVRRLDNEYRLGADATLFGARLNVMHGWVNFSDTTPQSLVLPGQGGNPVDPVTLSQLQRTEPYHGSSPYWRINLHKEAKAWVVGARYTYASSRRGFFFSESAAGASSPGAPATRQTLVTGRGSRPVSAGDLNVALFPMSRLTITNQTSFYNMRMSGDNSYLEVDNATSAVSLLNFQLLGIRTIANTTDLTYRAAAWASLYAGYQYSTRRIQSIESALFSSTLASIQGLQNNHVNAGLVGIRLQPIRPLTIRLDAEVDRASRPVFPLSGRNYHSLGGRIQFKTRSLLLAASARTKYDTNSVSASEHSSRARSYGLDASWTPRPWLAFDASYAKLHLDTVSGIAYFASDAFIQGDRSIYISNIHSGNLMARFGLGQRADLFIGYSRVQDAGDGRPAALVSGEGGSTLPVFLAAQTFPLTFESPLARFSLKLHQNVRWNAGYQFYHYTEVFQPLKYQAHTGYTSLLWSF